MHLVPPGLPWPLVPLVFLIEIAGLIIKPIALTIRLFANMTAGHAILAVLVGGLWGVSHINNPTINKLTTISAFVFILFIMLVETLIALIQAYIFTILTAIFISLAVSEAH